MSSKKVNAPALPETLYARYDDYSCDINNYECLDLIAGSAEDVAGGKGEHLEVGVYKLVGTAIVTRAIVVEHRLSSGPAAGA